MLRRPNLKTVPSLFLCLALLILFRATQGTAADAVILQLRNGDRITGTIIGESLSEVILTTIWSKEVRVPKGQILKRELPPVDAKPAAVAGQDQKPAGSGKAPTAPPPPKPKEQRWHGDLQLGVDLQDGEKTRQIYYGRTKLIYAKARFRNSFDANGTYGKTDGEVSANRAEGFAKTDFDLGKLFYIYNVAGTGYDEVRKIDLRYEVGPGIGYHALKLTNFVLNTEAGLNFQDEFYDDGTEKEDFFFRLAENTAWKVNTRFSLEEKFEFFPRVDLEQYRFRFETTLRYWLVQNLSLNLTVLNLYDSDPARNVDRNDLQIRSALGFKF
jgi:putative salt-induced outer membrane protein YdiY